jgi:two-component system sensor histidine kinase CpxA
MILQRLFWRIFGLFWTATLVVIVMIAWSASYAFETEKIPGLGITRMESALNEQLRGARQAMLDDGVDALRAVQAEAKGRGISLHVFDTSEKEVLTGQVRPDIAQAIAHATPDEQGLASGHSRLLPIVLPNGTKYMAVATFGSTPLWRMLYRRPNIFWNQVIIASLISAIFSAILAFYIAVPLSRIRTGAQRVAAGDLDARVGDLPFGRSAEMLALAHEFDAMAARLKELVDGQRRLVRDISHEMRSPLARQHVALELARSQVSASDALMQLDRIEREAERLEEMIAQSIQLSRMETTKQDGTEPIALDELVADIAADAAYEAQAKNCTLEYQQTASMTVQAEADLLASAIENIVRNAVNYTREDSTIRIHLDRVEHKARLRVTDTGPGVPDDAFERIFEPYFRTDDARARRSGGSGLGLAIAKRAVERQGGHIRASNVPGGGLEVEITLPLA